MICTTFATRSCTASRCRPCTQEGSLHLHKRARTKRGTSTVPAVPSAPAHVRAYLCHECVRPLGHVYHRDAAHACRSARAPFASAIHPPIASLHHVTGWVSGSQQLRGPPAPAMEVGLRSARGDRFENPSQLFELILLLEIANRVDGAYRLWRAGTGEVRRRNPCSEQHFLELRGQELR